MSRKEVEFFFGHTSTNYYCYYYFSSFLSEGYSVGTGNLYPIYYSLKKFVRGVYIDHPL